MLSPRIRRSENNVSIDPPLIGCLAMYADWTSQPTATMAELFAQAVPAGF